MPVGFVDGLPIGMQLVAKDYAEAKLLNVAHQFQQVTNWHKKKPVLTASAKTTEA